MNSGLTGSSARLILLFAMVMGPGATVALTSSCCTGGGGQSLCVLPSEQSFQLGTSTSYREIKGHFDPYGYYRENGTGTYSRIVTTSVSGAYRLGDDWQISASLPVVYQAQAISGRLARTTGLGDPPLEARYSLWEDLAFLPYRPELSFYAGTRIPVGTSVYSSKDPYGLDAIGDGTFTAYAGLTAAKLYRPVKLSFDAGVFYPFARSVDRLKGAAVAPYRFKLGNRLQLSEGATVLLNQQWSASAGLKQSWQFTSSIDGNTVVGSAARLSSSSLGINYFHGDGTWSFGASYETVFPFYRYLVNQPNYHSAAVTAIYAGL